MCACECMCLRVHAWECVCLCVRERVSCASLCVRMYVCVCVCACLYILCACLCVSLCLCVRVCVHVCWRRRQALIGRRDGSEVPSQLGDSLRLGESAGFGMVEPWLQDWGRNRGVSNGSLKFSPREGPLLWRPDHAGSGMLRSSWKITGKDDNLEKQFKSPLYTNRF